MSQPADTDRRQKLCVCGHSKALHEGEGIINGVSAKCLSFTLDEESGEWGWGCDCEEYVQATGFRDENEWANSDEFAAQAAMVGPLLADARPKKDDDSDS